ncbi:hypothetical protein Dimus_039678 [Dionaea muscipula]
MMVLRCLGCVSMGIGVNMGVFVVDKAVCGVKLLCLATSIPRVIDLGGVRDPSVMVWRCLGCVSMGIGVNMGVFVVDMAVCGVKLLCARSGENTGGRAGPCLWARPCWVPVQRV